YRHSRILESSLRVVDGAWSNDHQQPVISPMQDAMNLLPRLDGQLRNPPRYRELCKQMIGRQQFLDLLDPQVICFVKHLGHDKTPESERPLLSSLGRDRVRVGK